LILNGFENHPIIAAKYLMEIKRNLERKKSPDFFDENYRVSVTLAKEARDAIPEITDADLEAEQERFCVFLGDTTYGKNGSIVNIRAVLEADGKEKDRFYREGKREVIVDIAAIKQWVSVLKKQIPEIQNMEMVGDLHTHPLHPDVMEIHPCAVNQGDAQAIINLYEKGILDGSQPYIFAIAGRDREGYTEYRYYRMIKRGKRYLACAVPINK
jgi:hypothetical protein